MEKEVNSTFGNISINCFAFIATRFYCLSSDHSHHSLCDHHHGLSFRLSVCLLKSYISSITTTEVDGTTLGRDVPLIFYMVAMVIIHACQQLFSFESTCLGIQGIFLGYSCTLNMAVTSGGKGTWSPCITHWPQFVTWRPKIPSSFFLFFFFFFYWDAL